MKLTKAMAIAILTGTVAISTVGCGSYTVDVKDNNSTPTVEQQSEPQETTQQQTRQNESKGVNMSETKDNKVTTHKTTKQITTKKHSNKKHSSNSIKHEQSKPVYVECGICGKPVRKDKAVDSEAGLAHRKCEWKVEHTEQKGTEVICGRCGKDLGHADTEEEATNLYSEHYYSVHYQEDIDSETNQSASRQPEYATDDAE